MSNTPVNRMAAALLILGGALVAALPARGQAVIQPVKGLRVPFEFNEDGTIKTQLEAGTARVAPNGDVVASDVRVQFRRPDGSAGGSLIAGDCVYLRSEGLMRSDSPVRLDRDGLEISGKGMDWSITNKVVVIRSDAMVIIAQGGGQGLLGLALARKRTLAGAAGRGVRPPKETVQ